MGLIAPGDRARELRRHRHRAAVIGTVEQEALDQRRIAGHQTGAQTRQARALREAMEHEAALEARVAQPRRLRAADSAPAASHRDRDRRSTHRRRSRSRSARPARARAADTATAASCRWDYRVSTETAARSAAIPRRARPARSGRNPLALVVLSEVGLCTRQQRRALVDLIARIGHRDQRSGCRGNHRLHQREQPLAGAGHRQHHACPGRSAVPAGDAPLQRARHRCAQRRQARGWPDSCRAGARLARSVSSTNAGGSCLGSPIESAIGVSVLRRLRRFQQGMQALERIGAEAAPDRDSCRALIERVGRVACAGARRRPHRAAAARGRSDRTRPRRARRGC